MKRIDHSDQIGLAVDIEITGNFGGMLKVDFTQAGRPTGSLYMDKDFTIEFAEALLDRAARIRG